MSEDSSTACSALSTVPTGGLATLVHAWAAHPQGVTRNRTSCPGGPGMPELTVLHLDKDLELSAKLAGLAIERLIVD